MLPTYLARRILNTVGRYLHDLPPQQPVTPHTYACVLPAADYLLRMPVFCCRALPRRYAACRRHTFHVTTHGTTRALCGRIRHAATPRTHRFAPRLRCLPAVYILVPLPYLLPAHLPAFYPTHARSTQLPPPLPAILTRYLRVTYHGYPPAAQPPFATALSRTILARPTRNRVRCLLQPPLGWRQQAATVKQRGQFIVPGLPRATLAHANELLDVGRGWLWFRLIQSLPAARCLPLRV